MRGSGVWLSKSPLMYKIPVTGSNGERILVDMHMLFMEIVI